MSTDPALTPLHQKLFEEGLKVRREVVGNEYVDRALAGGSTEFSRAGQELVTEFCWGAPELAVHIRGAINNGLTEVEIREAILHATTYCGVPAGVDAMKTAERVLNEMEEKGEHKRELGKRVA
ncbi:hypothetical protein UREG_03283 [Uncinocarpus reesii 1704]|uniref:Carboxymuconolactone decarboxylase-like domain-containing protein n=1 Tax=Uncinocarpus reesii (strain UAMH 1704) TaxID=336963 RepID=C4JQ50_UNCRE|nr:uncharacterized protein UREG_03283 [Uncinocarpus reesii 1704]EEP78437.1 hypothetical protein UREG_03283 [Uncinocarpus reesii 1704]